MLQGISFLESTVQFLPTYIYSIPICPPLPPSPFTCTHMLQCLASHQWFYRYVFVKQLRLISLAHSHFFVLLPPVTSDFITLDESISAQLHHCTEISRKIETIFCLTFIATILDCIQVTENICWIKYSDIFASTK